MSACCFVFTFTVHCWFRSPVCRLLPFWRSSISHVYLTDEMAFHSYGKRMLEAALAKQVDKRAVHPPTEKVHPQIRIKEWLTCDEPTEQISDAEYGTPEAKEKEISEAEVNESEFEHDMASDGSLYQPSGSSSSEELHPSLPPFVDTHVSDVMPPSEHSFEGSLSVVFPMLQNTSEDANITGCNKIPLDSQIRKAFQNVTVAGGPKLETTGKRNYSKPDYCLYCKNRYTSKISAHYLAIHSTEPRVTAIMELPCGSKERKRLLTLLQNDGNHLHNCEVLQHGCGEITVSRRPTDKESLKAENYLPCTRCKAWILDYNLSIHSQSCPAGKSFDTNHSRNSKMMLSPYLCLDSDDSEIEDIIMKMKETSKHPGLKEICLNDQLIKEFCRGLIHKLGTSNEQRRRDKDNIRNKLRSVGRLLISLNEQSKTKSDLSSYIVPQSFMLVVKSVKEIGQLTPNLALALGHYIKQICQLKQSLAIQNDDDRAKAAAEQFDLLLGAHWNNYVSAVTLRRLKLRTLNKTIELPKKDDMVKLKVFLDSEITKSLKRPKPNLKRWTEACQALMVRILLFNKRRVSEVEELKVEDILQMKNSNDEDILSEMDITEKTLAKRMSVVEVRGKSTRGLRKVFVILSDEMLQACKHLIQTRMYVGIDQSNGYLFARPGGSALDGCKAMRDVTTNCPGLESPNLIRTRLLRKYLATTIQLLDMNGEELKMVADHMGHSVAIHTDVYRLQSSVLEKTKVARALIALENGKLGKFAGKNLSSCSFDDLPMPLFEEEENLDLDTLTPVDLVAKSDSDAESDMETEKCTKRVLETKNIDQHEVVPYEQRKIQKRKRWNAEEEASIAAEFKVHIMEKRNPTAKEIKAAQEKYPYMKERSVAVIKTKINNIILGKCKGSLSKGN